MCSHSGHLATNHRHRQSAVAFVKWAIPPKQTARLQFCHLYIGAQKYKYPKYFQFKAALATDTTHVEICGRVLL